MVKLISCQTKSRATLSQSQSKNIAEQKSEHRTELVIHVEIIFWISDEAKRKRTSENCSRRIRTLTTYNVAISIHTHQYQKLEQNHNGLKN